MQLANLATTRRVLDEWAAQGFKDDSYGIVMDAELESFGATTPRLVLKAFRRGTLVAIIYGYQTLAHMTADTTTRSNPNIGALVFADATNANNDLFFSNAAGTAWVADALWGMSNAFKAAITAINASQTLQTTMPTPGQPGAGVPANGAEGDFLAFLNGNPTWKKYNLVQRGGGAGQNDDPLLMGYDGLGRVKLQVGPNDFGFFWLSVNTEYTRLVNGLSRAIIEKLPNGKLHQFGSTVVTLDSFGAGAIIFPVVFFELDRAIAISGYHLSYNGPISLVEAQTGSTQIGFITVGGTPGTSVRINWDAEGR